MLDSVRKNMKTKNVIGWSLLIIICGVFVFIGLPQQFGIPGAGSVATVNGELISVADLQSEEQRLSQVFANFMGGAGNAGAQRQFLRQQALQNLVTMELVAQAAQSQGIWTSDEEIRDFIVRDIPAFQEDGHFQRERYRQYLAAIRSTPKEFENKLRKDRQNLRVRRLIETAVAPLDIELKKQEQLRNQQLNVEFVQLDQAQLASSTEISEAAVQEALAQEDFKKRVQEYYDLNKDQFSEPEQVKAQHILIKADPQKEGGESTIEAQVKKVQEELKTRDFAEVAKKYSEDPGSKAQGGDLGYFEKGRMTPAFEEVAFSLEPGQVSEPVETQFGTHIIKVNDRKPAKELEFEEVNTRIAKQLLAEEKVEAKLAELEKAVKEGQTSMVQAKLKELGAQWQETGMFSLAADRIPKLGSSPEVTETVFNLDEPGELANQLVRDGSKRYVLRLKGIEQKADAPAAPVLEEQVARDRSYAIYQSWVDAIRKDASVEINNALISTPGALPN